MLKKKQDINNYRKEDFEQNYININYILSSVRRTEDVNAIIFRPNQIVLKNIPAGDVNILKTFKRHITSRTACKLNL